MFRNKNVANTFSQKVLKESNLGSVENISKMSNSCLQIPEAIRKYLQDFLYTIF